jgi:hypothetical protein
MTDTVEEVFVIDTADSPPPVKRRTKAPTGTCRVCGIPLDDGRRAYCAEHVPERDAANSPIPRRKTKKTSTSGLAAGLTNFNAQILAAITLIVAWSQLRRAGVPDRLGNMADRMALTEDEAVAIARPLSRMFAGTDVGKKVGPALVGNEDILDAVFAGIDYYRRNQEIWDELARNNPDTAVVRSINTKPTTERTPSNGSARQAAENQRTDEPGPIPSVYVGPTDADIVGYVAGV